MIRAVQVDRGITLDGSLEEPAWQLAPPAAEFIQMDPEEGAPVTEPTEVRVLYDDEALYVGARFLDGGEVSTRLGRHDAYLNDADGLSVALDTHHDHRTAFQFRINPSGVRGDEVLSGGFLADQSWNPVWEGKTRITEEGWTAELRIPFSQLRFSGKHEQTWGIQIERTIGRKRERAVLSFTPKHEFGGIARYGHLAGLEGIRPGRRLEVLPYTVAHAEMVNAAPGDPFRNGAEYSARAGLDLKYRPTSNLTVDATFNPDFGQVELDPAQINLTAFETYYEERRPFFVEGAEIFDFGGEGGLLGGAGLFYSRRIGRAPGVWPLDAINVDLPEVTTIVGAAKLTGKLPGGWSLGVLNAVTAPERAPYVDLMGEFHHARVEPLSSYLVTRLRRDFRGGQSSLGGMLTAAKRDLSDPFLATQLRSAAYTGGVDFEHEWGDRAWSLGGYVTSSYVAGEPRVIEAAQRSSARYFQRPDADHLRVDANSTTLLGFAGEIALRRQAGRHWRGSLELSTVSPGYETNDLGFQMLADRIEFDADLRYVQNRPGKTFRHWSLRGGPDGVWNYGGDLLSTGVSGGASGQFKSYWGGSLSLSRSFGGLDDRLTRGGPLTRSPASYGVSGNVHSDVRKPITGHGFGIFRRDEAGGRDFSVRASLGIKPAGSWNISLGPTWSRSRSAAHYVTSIPDSSAIQTFGRRYVFAALDQETLGLETRLNVIFSPKLSLELYVQPFLSSGDFGPLKELEAPRSFSFDRYGTDAGVLTRDTLGRYVVDPDAEGPARSFRVSDRDFNFRSLRGNAVLRWEWRAGSTLFLVWQQRRSEYLGAFDARSWDPALGRLDLGRDASELFLLEPDNFLAIKISYWFNP